MNASLIRENYDTLIDLVTEKVPPFLVLKPNGKIAKASAMDYGFQKMRGLMGYEDCCKQEMLELSILKYVQYGLAKGLVCDKEEANAIQRLARLAGILPCEESLASKKLQPESKPYPTYQAVHELSIDLLNRTTQLALVEDLEVCIKKYASENQEQLKKYSAYLPSFELTDLNSDSAIGEKQKNMEVLSTQDNLATTSLSERSVVCLHPHSFADKILKELEISNIRFPAEKYFNQLLSAEIPPKTGSVESWVHVFLLESILDEPELKRLASKLEDIESKIGYENSVALLGYGYRSLTANGRGADPRAVEQYKKKLKYLIESNEADENLFELASLNFKPEGITTIFDTSRIIKKKHKRPFKKSFVIKAVACAIITTLGSVFLYSVLFAPSHYVSLSRKARQASDAGKTFWEANKLDKASQSYSDCVDFSLQLLKLKECKKIYKCQDVNSLLSQCGENLGETLLQQGKRQGALNMFRLLDSPHAKQRVDVLSAEMKLNQAELNALEEGDLLIKEYKLVEGIEVFLKEAEKKDALYPIVFLKRIYAVKDSFVEESFKKLVSPEMCRLFQIRINNVVDTIASKGSKEFSGDQDKRDAIDAYILVGEKEKAIEIHGKIFVKNQEYLDKYKKIITLCKNGPRKLC